MLRRATVICGVLLALAPLAPVARAAPLAATEAADRALALRFRPRLLLDSQERWRPLDVDRFLAEPGHMACPPPGGGACVPLTSVAQLTPAVASLDLRGTRQDGRDALDDDTPTAIYAHVVRSGRRIAIDYWWFLRFNAYSLDRHEGDWEGVTVVVDAAATRVLEVHFAAHADVWRYDADVPRIVDDRVVVYVARGGHASYPRRCTRLCRQTGGTLPEARFDGRRSWSGNSARGCRRRCVQLLPAIDGSPSSWDAWDGRWGATFAPAFPAPRTPAFQSRYARPFDAGRSHRHLFDPI